MKNYNQLKKNLKLDSSHLQSIKVAILGDTATQFLANSIKGLGYDYEYNFEIWEAEFDQIERQIFDQESDLYKFTPEIVIIFQATHKLLGKYNKLSTQNLSSLAKDQLNSIKQIYTNITEKTNAKVVFYNYPEINDNVFGNFANKSEESFLFQLRKLNFDLMQYASKEANLFISDISTIQNQIGKSSFFQSSIYVNTEMVLSIESLPYVAKQTVDLISAIFGKIKKCLILDLDNTLWGGIIGDDGIENIEIGSLGIGKAFSEFQYWIKKLKNRGIILAVCSKNTESVAKKPFENHPDMILKLEDFAVFMANWDNKADNIRHIQSILNIGFDSMVFLDDNPFERNMVREQIADICVPELPEDPAEYLEYLYSQNLFETISISNEDANRTKQYQTEAKRIQTKESFTNEKEFLKNLNMISLVEPFNNFNTPRVAQLSQRSNQFNLRTIRYTENDIKNISISKEYFTFTFSLQDKFGDNGLICVVVLQKENEESLFIESWFMSCRVLKRNMEGFTLNTLVAFAKKEGYKQLKGEYIATTKNEMVKNHYLNLGFEEKEGFWILPIKSYTDKKNYITKWKQQKF